VVVRSCRAFALLDVTGLGAALCSVDRSTGAAPAQVKMGVSSRSRSVH